MLGRSRDRKVGEYMRRVLEPMGYELGVDSDLSFFTPPTTDAAVAFEVYRCGLSLLMQFTYDDGWGVSDPTFGGSASPKQARQAAKALRSALHDDSGRDAISHMAQGYARETAATWRRAIDTAEGRDQAESLALNADRSEELGQLAAGHWPVHDEFAVLPQIASAERDRFFAVDNPEAMIDVRSAAGRTRAACEAAALALGATFDEFSSLLIQPVMVLNLELALGLAADWNFHLDHWLNLMSEHPVEFSLIVQMQSAAR